MKNLIKTKILALALIVSLSGCSDWLRIDPIDSILDDQVFASEKVTEQALNGIYLEMAQSSLYGQELTNNTIELLAQQYAVSEYSKGNYIKYYMNAYNYSDNATQTLISSIWSAAYTTTLDINYFIKKLEASEGVVAPKYKNIMLGEAYGLRAFMHFDMLRLFGPVYKTDSTSLAIPYYSDATANPVAREAANVIMGKILADINKSIEYLKDDPVIKEGAMVQPEEELLPSQLAVPSFYRYRNRRMNYYAVSALKARALMYRGEKVAAANLALSLINNSTLSSHFVWMEGSERYTDEKENRIAASEVLFGIHSPNMYSTWEKKFSPGLREDVFLGPTSANVSYAFDVASSAQLSVSTDYRAINWVPYSIDRYMSTYKFSRSLKPFSNWNYQPLIRKTELYYIIAEAQNSAEYLDEVRIHRGLKKLDEVKPSADIEEEILLEHIREFQGEGQLFYFYKRIVKSSIRSGTQTGATVSMDEHKYVLPIPQAELDR